MSKNQERIWLYISDFNNYLGSWWTNEIEKMMMPVFEEIANTYQNELKLNRIEQLWFVGYKSYISVHSLESVCDSRRNVARASNPSDWYQELGYKILYGQDVEPDKFNAERESLAEAILTRRLNDAIAKPNPDISIETQEDAVRKLLSHGSPSLIENNRNFHRMLIDGINVEYKRQDEYIGGELVKLIDFEDPENNDWLIINQFTIIEGKHNRRPDVVIFLNGLPLAVIELKNPTDEDATIEGAFKQLQTYKHQIPSLFLFNELLVISDGLYARTGSLTADFERFMKWRTIEGDTIEPVTSFELEVLIKGIFDKNRLLELIRYCIVFQDEHGKTTKKVAGYHQFHAVREAIKAIVKATSSTGDKKCGVVWHTQGSGKSLTMVFYAGKVILHPALENPTLVVLTDRNDLDNQLFDTFAGCLICLDKSQFKLTAVKTYSSILGLHLVA